VGRRDVRAASAALNPVAAGSVGVQAECPSRSWFRQTHPRQELRTPAGGASLALCYVPVRSRCGSLARPRVRRQSSSIQWMDLVLNHSRRHPSASRARRRRSSVTLSNSRRIRCNRRSSCSRSASACWMASSSICCTGMRTVAGSSSGKGIVLSAAVRYSASLPSVRSAARATGSRSSRAVLRP
jgi:hypothetical protein